MKKKILFILAMSLMLPLVSCGISPAEGGETESSSPPSPAVFSASTSEPTADETDKDSGVPVYYAAYQEIVAEYQKQYGIGSVQQTVNEFDRMTSLMGLCVIKLLDFDKDGTEELLLIWAEGDQQYHSYSYGIWTSPDGKSSEQICENRILDGLQSYGPYIELVDRTDGIFLGEDCEVADADEAHVYRKITVSGVSDALTLAYIPPFGQDERMLVNGQPVSDYDAYTQARENFLAGAEVTRIDLTSWSLQTQFTDPTFSGNGTTADEEENYFKAILHDTQDAAAALEGKERPEYYHYEWRAEDTYASFGKVVSTYLAGYGEPHILSSSRYDGGDEMPALGGLCVVRLLDLDQDGVEELVMAYPWKEPIGGGNHLAYQYSIWAIQNGGAVELRTNTLPSTAYEPTMALFIGPERSYLNFSYDINTEQAASIANVEFDSECHTYNGQSLIALGYSDIPQEAVTNSDTEWIYFSANSYRWSADMDWDKDSQRVLTKTQDTIYSLLGS